MSQFADKLSSVGVVTIPGGGTNQTTLGARNELLTSDGLGATYWAPSSGGGGTDWAIIESYQVINATPVSEIIVNSNPYLYDQMFLAVNNLVPDGTASGEKLSIEFGYFDGSNYVWDGVALAVVGFYAAGSTTGAINQFASSVPISGIENSVTPSSGVGGSAFLWSSSANNCTLGNATASVFGGVEVDTYSIYGYFSSAMRITFSNTGNITSGSVVLYGIPL